jgi:hypothetical protein
MTLLYMNGFDTSRDSPDFIAQGWLLDPSNGFPTYAPSTTGIPGFALTRYGTAQSDASAQLGLAGDATTGMYSTGITSTDAWEAGGFIFGCSARFNSLNFQWVANNFGQLAFDGSLYWAIVLMNDNEFFVSTSPDLTNWTVTSGQPTAGSLGSVSSIAFLGNGIIAIMGDNGATVDLNLQYTNDLGQSWTTILLGTATDPGAVFGYACETGNELFPHCAIIGTTANPSSTGIFIGNVLTTMDLATSGGNAPMSVKFKPRVINEFLIVNGSTIFSANSQSTTLNMSSAWSNCTINGNQIELTDIAYVEGSNQWVVTASGSAPFIQNFQNLGTQGDPIPPVGDVTFNAAFSGSPMFGLAVTDSNVFAFGGSGNVAVEQSPDGINWSVAPEHIISPTVGNGISGYVGCFFDGSKFILPTSVGATTVPQMIVATLDCVNDYRLVYISDVVPAETGGNRGLGIFTSASEFTSGSTFTVQSGVAWLNAEASTSTVTLYTFISTKASGTPADAAAITPHVVPINQTLTHYYEIQAVSDITKTNRFFLSYYIDGVYIGSSINTEGLQTFASGFIHINVPASMNWTQFDDMYFALYNKEGITNPLGPINIIARRPTTDIQDQWTNVGALTNSLSVNQPALSSNSSQFTTTVTPGDTDIYTSNSNIIPGYSIAAISMEGNFAKISGLSIVNVSVSSNNVEQFGTNFFAPGGVPSSIFTIFESNNGAPWTSNSVVSSEFVLNKVF